MGEARKNVIMVVVHLIMVRKRTKPSLKVWIMGTDFLGGLKFPDICWQGNAENQAVRKLSGECQE